MKKHKIITKSTLCKIRKCKKNICVIKHQLCAGHYKQLIRYGMIKYPSLRGYNKLKKFHYPTY